MSESLDKCAIASDGTDSVLDDLIEVLTSKIQAGELVDLAEVGRRHPEYAERLRRLLPALVMMADFGNSSPRELEGVDASGQGLGPGVLGDFRIVREIGRGGMGVVYEAQQLSLDRRVALKVLPMAAALDSKQLQRFQLEAHAAACLHHTNIVPVHAVGCERGVPFYAMQFIESRSLAQLIAELRRLERLETADEPPADLADISTSTLAAHLASGRLASGAGGPAEIVAAGTTSECRDQAAAAKLASHLGTDATTPSPSKRPSCGSSTRSRAYVCTVAQLGVQVAEALDHAHTRGILHRDIKPGNLLLDGLGQLWITDFGLAQIQGNPALTLTGDILGTLRYMSPEQALARRVVIDGRTDIYSLGVTLYELLTLRPAIEGEDRAEILRKIADDDPAPPRQHNPAVSRDLETIVLKAMAKEPTARYATARELADELRRFLEHKPIAARRPSLVDRTVKWGRRHRAVVWSSGVCCAMLLLMAVLALAASNVLVAHERDQKDSALKQREAALATARENEKTANANLQLARKAVDDVYEQLGDKIRDLPHMQNLEREFLHKALTFYHEFAKQKSTDPEIRLGTADAYRRVGLICFKLNQHRQAEEALTEAIVRYEQLEPDGPSERQYRLQLAGAYHSMGLVLNETKGSEQAEQAHRRSIKLLDQSAAKYPHETQYRFWLATAHNSLGTLLHDRPREAEVSHQEAIAICERLVADFPEKVPYWGELVRGHHTLGLAQAKTGRPQEAVKAFRDAITLFRRQAGPLMASSYRRLLPVAHLELAKVLHTMLELREASENYREAHVLYEQYVADYPRISEYWVRLYDCCANQVRLLEQTAHPEEAAVVCRRALNLYETLASRLLEEISDQGVPRIATGLHAVLKNRSQAHDRERGYRHALELSEKLAAQSPKSLGYQFHVVYWYNALGASLTATGRTPQAANAYRQVVEKTTALLAGNTETEQLASFSMFFLATAHWHLGHKHEARNWYDRAVAWMEKYQRNDPKLRGFHVEAAALLALPEPGSPPKEEVPRAAKG